MFIHKCRACYHVNLCVNNVGVKLKSYLDSQDFSVYDDSIDDSYSQQAIFAG